MYNKPLLVRSLLVLLVMSLLTMRTLAGDWGILERPYYFYFDDKRSLKTSLERIAVKFTPKVFESLSSFEKTKNRLRNEIRQMKIDNMQVLYGPRDELIAIIPIQDILDAKQLAVLLNTMETTDGVEYASPEFVDLEGYRIVLTDEFSVQLAVPSHNETWQRILKEFKLVTRMDKWRENVFYVKVTRETGFDPLTLSNLLFEQNRWLFRWVALNSLNEFRMSGNESTNTVSIPKQLVSGHSGQEQNDDPPPVDRLIPLDEYFYGHYHLDQTSNYDIDAPEAWYLLQANDSFVNNKIAFGVLDQGVQGAYQTTAHPDLSVSAFMNHDPGRTSNGGVVWPSPYVSSDQSVQDKHGTCAAGLIAAKAKFPTFGQPTPIGVVGVVPGAKVMDIRMLASTIVTPNDISNSFMTAISYGLQVVNCSWGGGSENADLTSTIALAAIGGRNGLGLVIIFASGNDHLSTVSYPARLSQNYPVIAVGACSRTGTWQYSNYGTGLDVVAPSDESSYNKLWTIDLLGSPGYAIENTNLMTNNNYTDAFFGTSGAAPEVAGVAGLMLCKNPFLTPAEVKTRIRATAMGLGDTRLGQGLVKAYGAVLSTPLPLANVSASSSSCGSATIQWTNGLPTFPESFFQAIEVWGKPVGGTYNKIAETTTKSSTSINISGLSGDVTWEFKVRARGRQQVFLASNVDYFSDFSNVASVFVQGLAAPSAVSVESAPGYVKMSHSVVPGANRYDANASASPGGPFYPRGQGYTTLPGWINMTSCYPPCLVQEVDTNLYYWTANGWSGSCPSGQSNPVGTFGAWHLKSASTSATKNNNQAKIAKGWYQHHVMAFESGGDVFFARSTDGGTVWKPEELVSQGAGIYSNPSIEDVWYYGGMSSWAESFVVWEENPVGANGYRIWARKRDNYNNTWGSIYLLYEDLSNRPTAAQPVVSGFFVFWRGPSGILWRTVRQEYPIVYTVPGTDANSNSPSVDLYWNYINEGTAHVAWEQTGAGIRYRNAYVNWNGTANWNTVYNIADNSGLTTNAKPTVARDYTGNACVAWEYKFITNGSIKFRTVAPNGTLSPITTFPNPPGSTHIPTSATLSHYRSTYSDNLTLSWHSPADGVISLYYRSGAWQTPFVVSTSVQHAHINNTIVSGDNTRLAMYVGTSGSPYRVFTSSLPGSTPGPRAPVLLYPANGTTGVLVPASLTWDYVIGASTYRLQVDDNSDFSSPVIDVSGWSPTSYYASLNTYTTYWWRVNATSPYGTSSWSAVWQFTTGDQLPPGCPFVYTWDGQDFVEDNNILPQALDPSNSGVDVLDSYRLMKPLVPKNDKYALQIREDGEDYSRFDNVALVAVDHPGYVDVAMRDDGSVVSYFKPFSLNHARLRERDVLREVSAFDSLTIDASGDFLDFGFRRFNPPGAPFVTPEWKGQTDSPMGPGNEEVVIEAGGSGGDPPTDAIGRPVLVSNGTTDGSFSPTLGARFRHNPSLVYIPLSIADTNNLQMQWPGVVTLDYVNLGVKVPARLTIRELALQRAVHDSLGVVTQALSSVDGNYAELAQGHRIELTFAAPSIPPALNRTFFFISTGRYEHVGDSPVNLLGKTASVQPTAGKPTTFALHQNYPNPFNPTTAIKYDLPTDVHVTLRVYDVLGRTVSTLVDEVQQSGYHQYQFDATNLASGVYFYSMNAGEFSSVKKLLLLR